jgi:hypothetical protein
MADEQMPTGLQGFLTFEALYRSDNWRGPMIVGYGIFSNWPSQSEWMVPNSDKEELR